MFKTGFSYAQIKFATKEGGSGGSGGAPSESNVPDFGAPLDVTGSSAAVQDEGGDEGGQEQKGRKRQGNRQGGQESNDRESFIKESEERLTETSRELGEQEEEDEGGSTLPYFYEGSEEGGDEGGQQGDQGEQGSEGEGEGGDEGELSQEQMNEYFYHPQRDADDTNAVYPNAYKDRNTAEQAIAEKLDKWEAEVKRLRENGADIGVAVDPDVKKQIDDLQTDYTEVMNMDDEALRKFLPQIDRSLKSVSSKAERVESKSQTQQQQKQIEQEYNEAYNKAKETVEQLELGEKMQELSNDPNASEDDAVKAVEAEVDRRIQEVDNQIQELENDDDYPANHGRQKWLNDIRDLENKKRDLQGKKEDYSQSMREYIDKQNQKDSQPKDTSQMSSEEYFTAVDEAYEQLKDDLSEGPNAIEIFQSDNVAPERQFRKMMLSPKYRKQYDITSVQGQYKFYKEVYKPMMDKKLAERQVQGNGKQQTKNDYREKYGKIRQPNNDEAPGGNEDDTRGDFGDIISREKSIDQGARELARMSRGR